MKKVIFLFAALAAVVMTGCNKPNDKKDNKHDTETPEPKKEFSFTMTFNEWYKKKPNHNYSNIRRGYSVPFDITIKDTDPEKNIVYVLKPVNKIDAKRHQIFGKDFRLYEWKWGWPDVIESKEIRIKDKNDTSNYALIDPIVPGLFQLDFQLQKYDTVEKKYIGDPVVVRASAFHVVQISAVVREGKLWWTAVDGEQQYDTYLSNYSVAEKYTYEFKCGKVKKTGEFTEGDPYSIDLEEFGGVQNLPDDFDLTIRQVLKNGDYNDIEYKDLSIKK